MTCDHCCGADQFFDYKSAKKQMAQYLRKGPRGSTKELIAALSSFQKSGKTLLDVGGGIGAIQWDFLQNNGQSVTDVDASSGYLKAAKEYAHEKNWESSTRFIQGDIVDMGSDTTKYDFVTLDKVVCCYPDYQQLLDVVLNKCDDVIALTYPLGGPIARFVSFFSILYMKLKKNPFRPYIHPPKKIRNLIGSHHFEPINRTVSFPWHVEVYQKLK